MTEERKQLVTENIALAHYVARKFRNSCADYEEIVSCAYMGLVKAAEKYDFQKGFSFCTFGVKVITNEILVYFRNESKHTEISLNTLIIPDEDITLEDMIPDKRDLFQVVETRFDIEKQIGCLSNAEWSVFRLKAQNPAITQTELGAKLGISQSYVARLLKSGKRKLMGGTV